MKVSSFTKVELDGSFVYFIFSKELLYIGETQRITFSRWVQHFQKNGTFTSKVNKISCFDTNYLDNINLLSVELEEIRVDFPEVRWRTITQAVEHSLHEILYKSQKELLSCYYEKYQPDVDRYTIISDTSRTAPKRIPSDDWIYAKNKAKEVLIALYKHI
jgi:hypothetical protein